MDMALIDVGALWLVIAGFILTAWAISATASLLFVPYLVWVSIAAALNRSVLNRNPGAQSNPA
jgi:tryptophan-rich sensory protein